MKQVILGTAGHIDHGKTSLIRALTGIDTDRLKEEKLRGITIELGFAHMELPGGGRLGIVDVPGHERFVKHMVAGASGIDLVALVVAADEGVMPQTREHMEICELLRVKKGLVVLTKIDMVDDPDWIEMVKDDVATFLEGTFLEGSLIVPVSSTTGEGIPELRTELARLYDEVEPRSTEGTFRLPVDRVFTMRGFGTVVTGTSISGKLHTGDSVVIYPHEHKSKVRGLQVHGAEVQEILPGQRTAVNLQGLERALIERGDIVAAPGSLLVSHMVDVYLELLKDAPRPLKHRAKVRFHAGSAEHPATVALLEGEELAPGEKAFVQLRFDRPVTVLRGDRFVLRSISPVQTVGGGTVLHPSPRKHKGQDKLKAVEALRTLLTGDDSEIILRLVRDAAWNGLGENELRILAALPAKTLEKTLQKLITQRTVLLYDKENRRMLHAEALSELETTVLDVLEDYHRRFPLKAGMSKEELFAQMPRPVESRLYNFALRRLTEGGKLVQEMDSVRLTSHTTDLKEDEEAVRLKMEKTFRDAGLQPPFFKEIASILPGTPRQHQDVLDWMLSQGLLVKVKEDLFFHAEAMAGLQTRLVEFLREHGEISTPQFKEMTQASRKYTIPLLEYFDTRKFTIRIGDIRKLRETRPAS